MTKYNMGDTIIFSTPKGTVKIGVIKEIRSALHQDEYEDVYTVELENGKIHYVDLNHFISKINNDLSA
jgi:hypothetical protein